MVSIGGGAGQAFKNLQERMTQGEMRKGWRSKRMQHMFGLVGLPRGARIVDVGGSPAIWEEIDRDFEITLVNLPGSNPPESRSPRFTYVEHDACDLAGIFEDQSFDFAFSNSTIEHVGDESRQEQFAREVRRLGRSYWVQTPSNRFPLEVHTWIPFYFSLPSTSRDRLKRRWDRKFPVWSGMIEETRVLSRRRMAALFPGARCFIERLLGLEKSYSFYMPLPDKP